MKHTIVAFIAVSFFLLGCGPEPTPKATRNPPTQSGTAEAASPIDSDLKEVVWDASWVDGELMFKDVRQFEDYVRNSDIAASGVLTDWDGTRGSVRLHTVFHGRVHDKTVPVVGTGGSVRPNVGERVLLLVNERDGELKLHSFCAASGLFVYSRELERIIQDTIAAKP